MPTEARSRSGAGANPSPRIVVIGSGVAGILVGIELRRRGMLDFTILEKADRLGGTWRDNVYPGVACDVAAHSYVYSFEPNAAWRKRYATGPELWAYFDRTARRYGVYPHIRFGEEVVSARWDGRLWRLETASGSRLEADIVISAVGRLHHPVWPDIAGLHDFGGALFHSARWDEAVPLDGRRIGVIGTGSTATQITVALSGRASRLSLFQRTPQWVLPMPDLPIPRWRRLWLRLNRRAALSQYRRLQAETEARGAAATGSREARAARDKICLDALATVRDPALRARLTPDYEVGCKRMVISERFYEAVQHENVELVTEPIERVEREGVRTADGRLHPLDVLVAATGFDAQAYMRPMRVTGADGVSLDEVWRDVALNYRSIAIPSMPNFFLINGPYSPGGSASVTAIIETHVAYVMRLVERVARDGVALAPKRERAEALLGEIRERARASVWGTGGCNSWYLDRTGTPTLDPITLTQLAAGMAEVEFEDFERFERGEPGAPARAAPEMAETEA